MGFGVFQVVEKMMKNSSTVAHACSGKDHGWTFHIIECFGSFPRRTGNKKTFVQREDPTAFQFLVVTVQQTLIVLIYIKGLERHGTVEVNRELFYFLAGKYFSHVINNLLSSSDGETGYHHLS